MSEATEYTGPVKTGSARAFIELRDDLNEIINGFMNDDAARNIGGRAIRLVSEERLTVYRHIVPRDEGYRQSGISEPQLKLLQEQLHERQNSVRPTIDRRVVIDPAAPPEGFEDEGSGIDLRFGVVFDDLTKQLLHRTTLLDEHDKKLYAHLRIRRVNMRLGPELTKTARALMSHVADPKAVYVRSLELGRTGNA